MADEPSHGRAPCPNGAFGQAKREARVSPEPQFDSRAQSVAWALAQADQVGSDGILGTRTGSDEWDDDLAALCALAAEVRRLRGQRSDG